ncbi:MAG TPA: SCP2 sterol-binding domain-containing protein [Nitrososphaerales archaeon]|nr:SCP2 sterol-binding domain-containing protein [Nitrososphaerales archaeon]
MTKFLSDEYFSQVQAALVQDQKWQESTKSLKTSIAFNVTDSGQNIILAVDNGVTTFQKAAGGTAPEFSFDGTYEAWSKLVKGDVDIQSAVLRGQLKFKGSLIKILQYKDRLTRVAEIMREIPKEF